MPYHLVAPTGTRVPLPMQPIRFGTDSTADVRLSSGLGLAPIHFVLQPNGLGFSLESLTPGHPVYVNDAAVEYLELKHGDKIKAGKFEVKYESDEPQVVPGVPQQFQAPEMPPAQPLPVEPPPSPVLESAPPPEPAAFIPATLPLPQVQPIPEPPEEPAPAAALPAPPPPPEPTPPPVAATSAFFTEEPIIPEVPKPAPAGYHQVAEPSPEPTADEPGDTFRLFATRPGLPEQRTVLTMGSYVNPTFPIVSARQQAPVPLPPAEVTQTPVHGKAQTKSPKPQGLHLGTAAAAAFVVTGIAWAGLETLRPGWGGMPAMVALKALCHLGGAWALGQAIGKIINLSVGTPPQKRKLVALATVICAAAVSSLIITLPVGQSNMSLMGDGIWCLIDHISSLRDLIGANISWTDIAVQMLQPWAILGLLLAAFSAWKHADES